MARYIDADELIKLVEEKDKEMWGDLCLGNVTDAIEQTQTVDMMTAEEFLNAWGVICIKQQGCRGCPIYGKCMFGQANKAFGVYAYPLYSSYSGSPIQNTRQLIEAVANSYKEEQQNNVEVH